MALITNDFIVQNGLLVNNTATILSVLQSTSTQTGALRVVGGVGIGGNINAAGNATINGNLIVGRTKLTVNSTRIESDNNVLHLSTGSLTSAGAIGAGLSIGPVGGAYASLLYDGGIGFIGRVSTSTHISGGVQGSIPYQTAAGQTEFIGIGPNNSLLVSNGSTASWQTLSNLQIDRSTTATNLDNGVAGVIPYQSAPGITSFTAAGTNGQILVSRGTDAPVFQSTLTLAGTTAASSTITGALQVRGGAGIGGNLYVGGTIFGNLTGNSQSATNVAGGGAGQLHYQVTTGITGFVGTGTANQILVSNGTSGPSFQNTSTIAVGYAANIIAGTSGQVPYQTAPGTTAFFGPGTAGNVLVSGGTNGPRYQNTLTLVGTTASVSPTTGALVVAGGAGIGENLYVGGNIYGNLIGTATNLVSGTPGSIPIQSNSGLTAFIPPGTAGQILQSNGTTATFVNTSTIRVGFAENLGGGATGSIPYQNAANSTTFLPIGTLNYVLVSTGSLPSWLPPDQLTIGYSVTATNLSGIFPGSVPYQATPGITAYTSGTSGQILVSRGTGAPVFQSTLTLAGTAEASSTNSGALQVAGGTGIGGSIFVGGTGTIYGTAASTTTLASNALYVAGGVGIGSSLLVTGPAVFQNDVVFRGTSTYVFSTETVYTDSIIELHYANPTGNWAVNDGSDIGIRLRYYDTEARSAFLGRDNDTGYLEWFGNSFESTTSTVTGTYGTFKTGSIILTSTDQNNGNAISGALQVAGGAGIAGNLWVGGTLNATAITGVSSTASNIAGGTAGQIPIQSGSGATAFIPTGTAGQLLQAGTNTATFVSTTTLLVGNAVNLSGGTAGSIAYQVSAGITGFITTASNGQILVSGGAGSPVYQNTLTLTGSTVASSTDTGALQVVGGAGIGGALFVGGTVTAPTFVGSLIGTATTATNIAGGALGSMPIQSAAGTTAFIPLGTNGSILYATATTATWTSTTGLSVGFATTAGNILGGTAGALNYQVSPGITGFIGTGTTGSLLQMGATTATFVTTSSIFVGNAVTATNIAGGSAGSVFYQTAAGVTISLPIGSAGQVLAVNGTATAPQWAPVSNLVINTATNIAGGTAGSLNYQVGPGITGFIGTGTTGSLLQMGATTATFVNTGSIFVGNAVTSTNIIGGTAGQVPYQTGSGATSFFGPGTAGNVLISNGTSAPSYNNTLTLAGTTAAVSTSSGALQVRGGVGIAGDLYVGGTLNVPTITGTITTATNIAGGTAGQLHYQSSPGITAFVSIGTAGQILVSNGTNAPAYQNTLTLAGTTPVSSTATGALQVVGGIGVGGGIFAGGIVTATSFVGALTGTASTATNLTGGGVGSIPIQSAAGTTAFIPLGINGYVLTAGATTATWQPLSGLSAGNATTATNIANGILGQIPYQSSPGITSFIGTGTSGALLQMGANTATFVTTGSIYVARAALADTATSATQVNTLAQPADANYYLTFVDSNNATATPELVYTTGTVYLNPSSGQLAVTTLIATQTGTGRGVRVGNSVWIGDINVSETAQIMGASDNTKGYLVFGNANTTALGRAGSGPLTYGGDFIVNGTTAASSTATGAFQVRGGVGIGGDLYVGGTIFGLANVSGTISTATNLAGSTAGSVPYQSAAGVTSYVSGTSGQVLVSRGSSAPVFQSTLTLAGTTDATSTVTGALQIAGGVGIGGSVFVGGTVTATNFFGALTGTATTTTNIAGGLLGQIPYQLSPGVTRFIGTGTTGNLLQMGSAGTATFVSTTTLQVGYAVHVLGGAAGSLIYQSGPNATTFLSISGSNGYVLTSNGTGPQWSPLTSLSITTATNIAGGTAGALNYQVSPGITGFIGTGTTGSLLQMGATTATFVTTGSIYVNRATLADTATNAATAYSLANTGTTYVNRSVTADNLFGGGIGSIPIQSAAGTTAFIPLGVNGYVLTAGANTATWQSLSGLSSGNAITATNVANGTAGQILYQVSPGITGFIGTGTTGSVLQMGANTATFVTTGSLYVGRALLADSVTGSSGQVTTVGQTADATYFLTFVDANNATALSESFFTTSSFTINPGTGGVSIGGVTTVTNTTVATSTVTGALQVAGGVGIRGNVYSGLDAYFNLVRVGRGAGAVATNVVAGNGALDSNTTGTDNVAVGYFALNQNTTGQYNVAVGSGAGTTVTTGVYNITLGYNAGNAITTGTNNTIIGSVSGTAAMTGTVIVAAGTTERFRIDSQGNMGIGTTIPSALLDVNGTVGVRSSTNATSSSTGALQVTGGAGIGGDLWVGGTAYATVLQSTSDVNFKKDITTITNALNTVLQLRGVEYKWKHNDEPGLGLIAQEVQPLVPAAVAESSDRLTVGYGNMVGLLVEAIKEQQQQILALQQEIQELKRCR